MAAPFSIREFLRRAFGGGRKQSPFETAIQGGMDTGCLFQQSLSLFGEMDRITATVFGFCAALDQFATLKDI